MPFPSTCTLGHDVQCLEKAGELRMRVNLNQLHVFYVAGCHKKMSEAARALYVSTPAVTMQVKKLETWLGFAVFERGRDALRFTARGQALFDALEPTFSQLDSLGGFIEDLMRLEEAEEVALGTHHLPGNYFIPDLIAHVRSRNPRLKVCMELGRQDWFVEELQRGKLDLALIIGDLPRDSRCAAVHLFDEEMALVTAGHGAFAQLASAPPAAIASMPMILQQTGTGARRVVLDFLERHGVAPDILLDNLSSDVIKQFLYKMPSVALIARFIVRRELEEGRLHEIRLETGGKPVCRFRLAYLDRPRLPSNIQHFLAAVRGFSPDYASGGHEARP